MGTDDETGTMLADVNPQRQDNLLSPPAVLSPDGQEMATADPVAAPDMAADITPASGPEPAEDASPFIRAKETIRRPPPRLHSLYDAYQPKPPVPVRRAVPAPADESADAVMIVPEMPESPQQFRTDAMPVDAAAARIALEAWSGLAARRKPGRG